MICFWRFVVCIIFISSTAFMSKFVGRMSSIWRVRVCTHPCSSCNPWLFPELISRFSDDQGFTSSAVICYLDPPTVTNSFRFPSAWTKYDAIPEKYELIIYVVFKNFLVFILYLGFFLPRLRTNHKFVDVWVCPCTSFFFPSLIHYLFCCLRPTFPRR